MDSIETRQRIKYLVEHGGLWEQAEKRRDKAILGLLAVVLLLQVVTLLQ
ncbi:hypothetical protein UFOVP728_35 [uncultured Caudovirales phage]|uniref:Uncharacterized protein n=1 Tax=uncultured Caudovirales phage TaxID=2100421 RepID=A0A6J5NQT7_9CAUD|nr:hypothetical protein UFOVP728_35 [uncultured Caudovirales phage]